MEMCIIGINLFDYRNNPRAAVCFINDELKKHNPQLLLFSSDYIPIMRASTLIDKPFGTCIDYTFAATALLRSKGIPVSIDYTPQWPDRFMGHYWNTVLTERRKKYDLTDLNPILLKNIIRMLNLPKSFA